MTLALEERAPLKFRNTLRVDATAAWLATVAHPGVLEELLAREQFAGVPVLVLGEGSNVLFVADFPGLVIQLALDAITIVAEDTATVRLEAGAGVVWDQLVDWTFAHGCEGLENLALIPGLTGAAPIQNIGAYGVEIREFIVSVTAWDRTMQRWLRLANDDCEFGYRDSRLKRETDRYIVTAVELELPRRHELRLDYPGLREVLGELRVAHPRAADVATAVRTLRRRKLPDPAAIGNAGSFFKNPIVSRSQLDGLRALEPALPWFATAAHERFKLSAAWLIERCGFKGYRIGDAGVSERHALVFVNHGQATGRELLALANHVIETVERRFGLVLEPEPRIITAD